MDIAIISRPLHLHLHGFGDTASNGDYAGVAFRLSDRMWKIVKASGLPNKGKNIWVYEPAHRVFAGVELEDGGAGHGLDEKKIELPKYALHKHVGPYSLIGGKGEAMRRELTSQGFQIIAPYLEVYGHWTGDESKQETDLLMALA